MKYRLISILSIIKIIFCTLDKISIVERLNAVLARKPIPETLYLRTRRANDFYHAYTEPKKLKNLDLETKNRICHFIMSSSEYTSVGKMAVDMIHEISILEELKIEHPDIFERVFNSQDLTAASKLINPTRAMNVFISPEEQLFTENVFICLSVERRADGKYNFMEHFVSEEYNMNNASDFCQKHIAGRFVFIRVEDPKDVDRLRQSKNISPESLYQPVSNRLFTNDPITVKSIDYSSIPQSRAQIHLLIQAVAEEPAVVALVPEVHTPSPSEKLQGLSSRSDQINVELLYLSRRKGKQPAKKKSDDPLCQLNIDEKFRVCVLVFNSNYFKGRFKLTEGDYNSCEEKEISFRRYNVATQIEEIKHKEWMIPCYTSKFPYSDTRTNSKDFYFLSRAYNNLENNSMESNDVFLYHQKYDPEYQSFQVFLVNAFTNIRLGFNQKKLLPAKL